MMRAPNLARDPFVNRRPIRRLSALFWVLAVGLLVVDGWLYWVHFAGQGRQRTSLEELEAGAAQARRRLQAALSDLDGFDLDWQREQITFLNAKIAERTFSWSALFDHLSEVLPRSVRVERVTPQRASRVSSRRRRGRQMADDEVILELTGAAEQDEALLVLVDAFFAHERFRRPNLKVEARTDKGSQVTFSMTVSYRPQARESQLESQPESQATATPAAATAEMPDGGEADRAEPVEAEAGSEVTS